MFSHGCPAWRKGSVPFLPWIVAEMEKWLSVITGREQTWGSRAPASQVNPTSWHHQRAGKQNYISSGHVLKRNGGCHFCLCTA